MIILLPSLCVAVSARIHNNEHKRCSFALPTKKWGVMGEERVRKKKTSFRLLKNDSAQKISDDSHLLHSVLKESDPFFLADSSLHSERYQDQIRKEHGGGVWRGVAGEANLRVRDELFTKTKWEKMVTRK